jgi:hypothetical protein
MRWLVLALGFCPAAAWAQAQPADAFASVIQDAGHHAAVLDAARQTPVWVHDGCASATFNEAPEIGVYIPVQFNPAGAPVAGEWREGIVATGCGAAITLNVLTKVTATATLATGPLLPGGTIADPVLQNAAQANALVADGGIPAACHDAYVANTAFGGYEGAGTAQQHAAWKEIWTLSLCGAVKNVVLHFVPDGPGITVKANAGETTNG